MGAGINFKYDSEKNWGKLEKDFKTELVDKYGRENVNKLLEKTFNTKYGSFQVMKDLMYDKYVEKIKELVNFVKRPVENDGSTLVAVANVIAAQMAKTDTQRVLTFNYDDLLEKALSDIYHADIATLYKGNDKDVYNSILITHSHGYLPNKYFKKHLDSVVLTTNEYIDSYSSERSYGYRCLMEHLNDICSFVGNSITDHEEQKVLKKHFNKHPSSFHFYYDEGNSEETEIILYKSIYLIKIGVIPLWYSKHNEYANNFNEYANNITGKNISNLNY